MTPEEMLLNNRVYNYSTTMYPDIIKAMKEYGDQERKQASEIQAQALLLAYDTGFIVGRDKALDWAAENATAYDNSHGDEGVVDQDSILSGKTSKDLQP